MEASFERKRARTDHDRHLSSHSSGAMPAYRELIHYYSEAGPDYGAWSPKFNMHFGYYASGMNPFRLEPMLERMNGEVIKALSLAARSSHASTRYGLWVGGHGKASGRGPEVSGDRHYDRTLAGRTSREINASGRP